MILNRYIFLTRIILALLLVCCSHSPQRQSVNDITGTFTVEKEVPPNKNPFLKNSVNELGESNLTGTFDPN
jgi:hypothetical protein